ncbi:MAG: L-seryl-tRNA(Sec) selenium transferase [Vicinamibacteria bacterium]|nr:L-seryl-tRNA(Sec) selenium transferase [Vicinamibacteria bacterium]
MSDPRRALPSVDRLLARPALAALATTHGRPAVVGAVRDWLEAARAALAAGRAVEPESVEAEVAQALARRAAPSLVRVINATGVVVHTNLGRAPLPAAAAERVALAAAGYTNLEFDLASGARGQRETHSEARLARLLGVEAAATVNNCAAAVMLALDTLACGREVIVSRGELVEIGGSFRIPDVMTRSGARLVEVGTTNRTRLDDYRRALTPQTAAILKVHPSNFRVSGFTESVEPGDLAALAREAGVPLLEDQGSGLLHPAAGALSGEPCVARSLAAGVDVVMMSGDKLLGGPQAGLIVGAVRFVAPMRKNPLYRALRLDKLRIAALDAVLDLHERGRLDEVPVRRMLDEPAAAGEARARAFADALRGARPGLAVEVRPAASAVGGGAAPDVEVPGVALHLRLADPGAVAARLRAGAPPVVARVADDALWLDLRTVRPGEEDELRDAVLAALA